MRRSMEGRTLRRSRRSRRKPVTRVLLAAAMIAVVVGVDALFFRGARWFWERRIPN